MSDSPRDPTDVRDEALAARLAVEPLDDVTRARLVRNAMEASAEAAPTNEPARRSGRPRWLAVAAALVVVLAVGLAVVLRDDSDSAPSAARASRAPSPLHLDTTTDLTVNPEAANSLEFGIVTNPLGLGDLGDVGSKTKLRRAVAAAEAVAPASESKSSDEAAAQATTALPRTTTTVCAPPRGEILAFGTGTAHGQAIRVYILKRKDDSLAAVAVGPDCKAGEPVPL